MQNEDWLVFEIKVKNVVVFLLFTLIFLTGFKADYFNQIAIYNRLESPLRLMTTFGIFLYLLLYQRGRSYKVSMCISLFFGLMFLLDKYHGDYVYGMLFLSYVAIFMFIEAQLQDSFEFAVGCMAFLLGAYIVVNLLTVLLFPGGLFLSGATHNPCYLLGHRNTIVKYAIPMIAVCALWAYVKKQSRYLIYTGVFFGINLLAAFRVWSGSALVSLVLMGGVMFVALIMKKGKLSWAYIGGISLFVAVSIYRIQEKFAFLIEDILHKDMSMTGRTDFWDIGIGLLKQNMMTGVGQIQGIDLGKYLEGFFTLHSFYLDMLVRGGLVLFVAFWAVMFGVSRKISATKDATVKAIFLGCMSGYLCLGLVEPISDAVFVLLFAVLLVGYWAADRSKGNEIQSNNELYL